MDSNLDSACRAQLGAVYAAFPDWPVYDTRKYMSIKMGGNQRERDSEKRCVNDTTRVA